MNVRRFILFVFHRGAEATRCKHNDRPACQRERAKRKYKIFPSIHDSEQPEFLPARRRVRNAAGNPIGRRSPLRATLRINVSSPYQAPGTDQSARHCDSRGREGLVEVDLLGGYLKLFEEDVGRLDVPCRTSRNRQLRNELGFEFVAGAKGGPAKIARAVCSAAVRSFKATCADPSVAKTSRFSHTQ
jgi:hypothetical protein